MNMDGGREKVLVCGVDGSSGTGSSDARDCLGWQSASYRCEYNGVSVGVDFDGGGVCAEKRDVLGGPMSLDLSHVRRQDTAGGGDARHHIRG